MSEGFVLVTGATGFLGRHLVLALLASGVRPHCLRRAGPLPDLFAGLPVSWLAIRRPAEASRHAERARLVFHCAARTGTAPRPNRRLRAANVELTRAVLAGVERGGGRLVHCSTALTLGYDPAGGAVDEAHPGVPLPGGYVATKAAAEAMVLDGAARGVDALVVNPCYLLGPGDHRLGSTRILWLLLRRRLPFWPVGSNNFADVRDVAAGLMRAAERGRRGERYLLGGENLSWRALLERAARLAGIPPPHRSLPPAVARWLGAAGDLVGALTGRHPLLNRVGLAIASAPCRYDCGKARRALHWESGALDGALRDALAWLARRRGPA
ncbi:MAG: dihydroflavonol 4-reductase [Porticoccaceae bacterium]|nr:MAG: dihydroflavonol 4-reductase [Porticoccaceae bacterium]